MISTEPFIYQGWLGTLGPCEREDTLSLMRSIRDESTALLERSRLPSGVIPVGAGLFDLFLQGETLSVLLRQLGNGDTPDQAGEVAKVEARAMIEKWNNSREWQVQRWEGTADTLIERKVFLLRGC